MDNIDNTVTDIIEILDFIFDYILNPPDTHLLTFACIFAILLVVIILIATVTATPGNHNDRRLQ